MDKPIDRRRLAKRDSIPARGRTTRQQVNLFDIKLDKRTEPRLVRENGRFQLAVELGANGVDVRQPFANPKQVALTPEKMGAHLSVRDLDGERPRGVETRFLPEEAPRTHRRRPSGNGRDKGGTISIPMTVICSRTPVSRGGPPARCAPQAAGAQAAPSGRDTCSPPAT
jgi:hypothetical protein